MLLSVPPAALRSFHATWIVCIGLFLFAAGVVCMTEEQLSSLRDETRDTFYHGYDNYMRYAFPEDELRPLTCGALFRDRANPAHIEVNDVLGNYSLTLIDSLSTLAILASDHTNGHKKNEALNDFQDGIAMLVEQYGDGTDGESGEGKRARGFDLDSKVQVFETVIRGVGGLLSAHLFAVGELPIAGYTPQASRKWGRKGIVWSNGLVYDGQLLRLATDLAQRILPAFDTPTGLPYPRVNLRDGVRFYPNAPVNQNAETGQCDKTPPPPEITETCSAGAGSLVLEFTTLSRLTGDWRFEIVAKRAFWAVWDRRHQTTGLIGAGIDSESGEWVSPYTGIGAGVDSFFEYAFKSHILLSGVAFEPNGTKRSDDAFLDAWKESHNTIKRHIFRDMHQHPHYTQVDLNSGASRFFWIDSLSAFYPGLLALAGEVEEAIETHLLYTALWDRYSALPERWSVATGNIEQLHWWGGRPEFIESTWYLYRATQDPFYLHVGEMTLRDIRRRCWTQCGWAGIEDVRTGELKDRMESFFLGETTKYLHLLFDPEHPLNKLDAPFVFTTEGHPLIIPKHMRHGVEQAPQTGKRLRAKRWRPASPRNLDTCPVPPAMVPFSLSATAARQDLFHAASLARLHLVPESEPTDSSNTKIEFAQDHPSLSAHDSPSDYAYYPWTLPQEMMPWNASSSLMSTHFTLDLTFPQLSNNALNVNLGALQRVKDGILINSMSSLRFGMISDGSMYGTDLDADNALRIYSVSNVNLGRDEHVFLPRDVVSTFNAADPYFTRLRNRDHIDLVIDVPASASLFSSHASDVHVNSNNTFIEQVLAASEHLVEQIEFELNGDGSGLFSNLLQNIQNLISTTATPSPTPAPPTFNRYRLPASLPTGPGAAPLPDTFDPSLFYRESETLPYQTIWIADDLCTTKLPQSVPLKNQIIVIQRGGCSFSEKLANIPAFVPGPLALQLVIIVSYPEHDDEFYTASVKDAQPSNPTSSSETQSSSKDDSRQGHSQHDRRWAKSPNTAPMDFSASEPLAEDPNINPMLDQTQQTASGIPRPHPIPMVLVNGGEQTMRVLKFAKGVGIRRRWHFASQGRRIGNLIVL